MKADVQRAKHKRRTARALYAEIKAAGCEGCCRRLTDFIRARRTGGDQSVSAKAFEELLREADRRFRVFAPGGGRS